MLGAEPNQNLVFLAQTLCIVTLLQSAKFNSPSVTHGGSAGRMTMPVHTLDAMERLLEAGTEAAVPFFDKLLLLLISF